MKQYNSIVLLLCACFLFKPGRAQTADVALHLQTDKKIYVSGESIALKCTVTPPAKQPEAVLLVDICGEGYSVSSYILKPQYNQYHGQISIPDSVQTGVYLLRAYIGNEEGIPTVMAQPITVINRFGNNSANELKKQKRDYQAINQLTFPEDSGESLKTYSKSNEYTAGKTVPFEIENDLEEVVGGLSFSVFKIDYEATTETTLPNNYPIFWPNINIKIYETYTIRGIIYDQTSQKPAPGQMVFLSVPDSIAQIKYDVTNQDGTFMFKLDDISQKEKIIIQTRDKSRAYNIRLFPSQLMPPETIPFYIPTEVENSEFVKLTVQRALLHSAYGKIHESKTESVYNDYPFYGYPEEHIIPEEFVPLENFKEIAWEILPTVKYKNTADSTFLKIWCPRLNTLLPNPMIMIDGVPISSPASVSSFNSGTIKWVDVQPDVRCYGRLMFEGLINIQTFNGDFSNVKIPRNALETKLDDFYATENDNTNKPFFRDVLFWEPYIESINKVYSVDVKCSDETGKYVAVAQAYNKKGELIRSVFQFEVK